MIFKDIIYKFNENVYLELEEVSNGKWSFRVLDYCFKGTGSRLSLDIQSSNKLQFHKFGVGMNKSKFEAYMDMFSDKINEAFVDRENIVKNIRRMQQIKFELKLKGNEHFDSK
jgi:hypothetical protein